MLQTEDPRDRLSQARDYGTDWYLAQLKPNAAQQASRNLDRQGFETFLPLERVTRRKGSLFVDSARPYFSGYIFVGCNRVSSPWQAIRSTLGVSNIVTCSNAPIKVPGGIIRDLKSRCDERGFLQPELAVEPGSEVTIVQGTFAKMAAHLEKLEPNERAWVLIEFLGKRTRVSVPTAHLRPGTNSR